MSKIVPARDTRAAGARGNVDAFLSASQTLRCAGNKHSDDEDK